MSRAAAKSSSTRPPRQVGRQPDYAKFAMLLEHKVAVIYGAGGPIGGAVARAFAREGARVFLAGRTKAKLDTVGDAIRSNGRVADTAVVDALDQRSVDTFVDAVAEQAGSIDISFNVISYGDVQKPLMELSVEDFTQPITTAMRTQFVTTRAAARHQPFSESPLAPPVFSERCWP